MPGKNIVKIYDENGYYHVYNRGVEKRNIFLDEQDYAVFLSYLKKYLSPLDDEEKVSPSKKLRNYSGEIDLLCYCLMPNHFHLLLRQHSLTAITNFLRSILTRYSMYFNAKYERTGHLFQGAFRAVVVNSEEQLIHLTRYIHRNPGPAGSDPVGLMEYRYSSLPNYLGVFKQSWIKDRMILDLFSKTNDQNSYKAFVFESNDLSAMSLLLIDEDLQGLTP